MSHNQNMETIQSKSDKFKIAFAILILAIGVFAYYWYAEQLGTAVRVAIFVASIIIAALLVWLSDTGKRVVQFGINSYHEVRRVVWPTRKETIQMTGIVFAFVAVMGLFLWIVDKLVEWIIYSQFLGWGG